MSPPKRYGLHSVGFRGVGLHGIGLHSIDMLSMHRVSKSAQHKFFLPIHKAEPLGVILLSEYHASSIRLAASSIASQLYSACTE